MTSFLHKEPRERFGFSARLTAAMLLTLAVAMAYGTVVPFAQECEEIRGETLRLHILANSDSEEDQRVKLLVRDAVLREYGTLFGSCEDNRDAAETAMAYRGEIRALCEQVLAENGAEPKAEIMITEMYFSTRTYEEGVTLPAGNYLALRILLGEGKGRNWWCVMYPPLCIPAASEEHAAQIEQEIRALSEAPNYQPKFAVVELYETLKEKAGGLFGGGETFSETEIK